MTACCDSVCECLLACGHRHAPAARVAQMRAEGQRWGVTGIPAIFLLPEGWTVEGRQGWTGPDPIRVSGAQPIEVLREAVRRVGGQPR